MFLFGGRYVEKMEKTRNIFFDKVQKARFLNKMKIEEEVTLDGKTWYHIKYDNTAPKTAFLFTYLPYNMEHPWTYEGGREHTANGGVSLLRNGLLVDRQIRQDHREEDDRLL